MLLGMTHRMGPKGQSAKRVTAVARLKAGGGMAYSDAFATATARARAATLLTGDPEILASGACRVEDLR